LQLLKGCKPHNTKILKEQVGRNTNLEQYTRREKKD